MKRSLKEIGLLMMTPIVIIATGTTLTANAAQNQTKSSEYKYLEAHTYITWSPPIQSSNEAESSTLTNWSELSGVPAKETGQ